MGATRLSRACGWSSQNLLCLRFSVLDCLSVVASVLVPDEPMYAAQRHDRRREREQLLCIRGGKIDDHQLSDDGEQRNQDYRANLHDAMPALRDHQQRAFELEGDDDRKDHSEEGLEDLIVGGVEST